MGVTATNFIMGPGTLYLGAFGAAEPADTAINATPQASAWTDVGGTVGGSKFTITETFTDLDADQIVDLPGARLTKREAMVSTSLAESTLNNLISALNSNGTAPTTGVGFASYEPPADASATQPTFIAVLLDAYAPGTNFRRRLILRKCINKANIESAYAKDQQTLIPVEFHAYYVSPSIRPFKFIDQTA